MFCENAAFNSKHTELNWQSETSFVRKPHKNHHACLKAMLPTRNIQFCMSRFACIVSAVIHRWSFVYNGQIFCRILTGERVCFVTRLNYPGWILFPLTSMTKTVKGLVCVVLDSELLPGLVRIIRSVDLEGCQMYTWCYWSILELILTIYKRRSEKKLMGLWMWFYLLSINILLV